MTIDFQNSEPKIEEQNFPRRNIIVYGMNYSPEFAGVGKYTSEISNYMSSIGSNVTVLTAPPHYPGWKVQSGFHNVYSSETKASIKIIRAPVFLKREMAGIWRLIAPLSFAIFSAPIIFWLIIKLKPDFVLCIQPTLFCAPIAQIASKFTGSRIYLHVQDLEVDAAFAMGHLRSKNWLQRIAYAFERRTLGRFDKLITISSRMSERLVRKGIKPENVSIVRNWVDLSHIYPLDQVSAYRSELGYLDDDFLVLYSGNIGVKQGLHVLLKAAENLKRDGRIKFIVAGEGPLKDELERVYGGNTSVRFLSFQPYSRLNEFLNMADLHVLPQDKGAADLVLPSKLGGMLATGKPVLVTADPKTELAEFLHNAALISPPGDHNKLAAEIKRASQVSVDDHKEARLKLAQGLSMYDGLREFSRILCKE